MDYTQVDPEWAKQYEAATAAVRAYFEAEGVPADGALPVAINAQTRTFPSKEDLQCQHWPVFYPGVQDTDPDLWADADEQRRISNRMYLDVTRANAKAEADRVAAHEAEEQANRDAELADLTEQLRRRYLNTPGGTEATFAAAMPQLLEDHRRRLVRDQQTADDQALAAWAAEFRI